MNGGYNKNVDRDKLILSFLPLVKRIAARLYIPSPEIMDKEDLVSHGLLGLMDAVERFDQSREVSFESYAARRIKGAMLDAIRALSFSPRSVNDRIKYFRAVEERLMVSGEDITEERLSQELGLSINQVRDILGHIALRSVVSLDRMLFSDEGEEVAVSAVIGYEQSPNPESILEESDLRNRLITAINNLPQRDREILSLYYIEELTLKEIAAILGVTEGRVSQLHSRAIIRLRAEFGKGA